MVANISGAISSYGKFQGSTAAQTASRLTNFKLALTDFNKAMQDASSAYRVGAIDDESMSINKKQGSLQVVSAASQSLQNAYEAIKTSEDISTKAVLKEANMADVVTAITNADLALQSIITIRDKVLSAYMDIIKLQI
jgi:flagellar hook-basal body complex protein FliE